MTEGQGPVQGQSWPPGEDRLLVCLSLYIKTKLPRQFSNFKMVNALLNDNIGSQSAIITKRDNFNREHHFSNS